MIPVLELDKEGYKVPDCRDTLNGNLSKARVGKRYLFYLVCVESYFSTNRTIKQGYMLSFNATCISDIDLYCVLSAEFICLKQ